MQYHFEFKGGQLKRGRSENVSSHASGKKKERCVGKQGAFSGNEGWGNRGVHFREEVASVCFVGVRMGGFDNEGGGKKKAGPRRPQKRKKRSSHRPHPFENHPAAAPN